jgi:hypothetical protein
MDVKRLMRGVMACALAAIATSVVAPASATTLIRESLDDLVRSNGTIVVAEVVDMSSYWNADGTFILTDVRVAIADVLKGDRRNRELTFTVMGGSVGELTTLIIGNPELVRGNSYVLFLNEEDLPGTRAVTVRDLVQGVFDVRIGRNGLRAISQANAHPLLPDAFGSFEAEGGHEGFPLNSMVESIRELAGRQSVRREVQ